METPEPAYPHYHVPKRVLLDLAAAALLGWRRSFGAHARLMMTGIEPGLVVEGRENIPQAGPGVITVNHYYRAGYWSPWTPAVVSANIPGDLFWTMAEAWTYPNRRLGKLYRRLSRELLTRVAQVYGFNTMPPMPPAADEAAQRAASVRRLIAYARANPRALIGLAPEGGDQPGGVLHLAPDGFGRLALALARLGIPFYPVGLYEEAGTCQVRFGQAYCLAVAEGQGRGAADRSANRRVMQAIAECLPDRLRGEFRR